MINCILILMILFLLTVVILFYKKLKYMCGILDEVLEGNLNQRIRFQSQIKILNILGNKINKLIQTFQEINIKNIINEESRKKMISNISHDLRTPLTSMLGYMELIFEDKELEEEKKQEYLKVIYDKGQFLYGLMEEFFQVSKLDSNDTKLELKEINISEIVRQSIVSFFAEIQKLNIDVKINISDKDIYGYSDKKSINRILNNLINNAIKHGIQATVIGIDLKDDKDNIYIEVYDNGIGIPDKDIESVFDRLYTVEKSRNSSLKNSGLGLTIVKKLVENLNGSISLSSIPYEKTSFKVRLPKKTPTD